MTPTATATSSEPVRAAAPPTPAAPGAALPWPVERRLLVATAVVSLVVPALAGLNPDVPGRALLAVALLFIVPGVPVALALKLPDALVALALALAPAVSLSFAVLQGTDGLLPDGGIRWAAPASLRRQDS